jgi:hypothetical protein
MPRPTLGLGLSPGRRRTPPRPTPGLGLGLGPGRQRTPPCPTPGLGLGLGPGRRRTLPRPTPGLGLGPDLSRRSPPRPTLGSDSASAPEDDELRLVRAQGLGLDLDLGRQTQPRPRRSLRLARPRARTDHITGGAIITLPLASSGYGEQDQRPIWLALVKQIMMAPRVLHDDSGSQPPYRSKETLARTRLPRQLSFRQAPALL